MHGSTGQLAAKGDRSSGRGLARLIRLTALHSPLSMPLKTTAPQQKAEAKYKRPSLIW